MAEATGNPTTGIGSEGSQPRRRRRWIDIRLIVGVALVAASVAGVTLIVALADQTTPVYAARIDLSAGDPVTADKLMIANVQLGTRGVGYAQPGDLDQQAAVATRHIAAGDLVPISALGAELGVAATTVVVPLVGEASASVSVGAVVDVWAARSRDRDGFDTPAVLVPGASVVRLFDSEGFMRSGQTQVELLIPKARVPAVLDAIANADAVSLVPVHQKWQG